MRCLILIPAVWSLLMGQMSGLAWVELADTVYRIDSGQDTVEMYIQSRSGNVRRFDRHEKPSGGSLFLVGYDSVYLDGSGRASLVRSYGRPDPNSSFTLELEAIFTYTGASDMKIDFKPGGSSTVEEQIFMYGLTRFEGALAWSFIGYNAPLDIYPVGYHTGQYGDSVLIRSIVNDQTNGLVRKTRPGDCDTLIFYSGAATGTLTPFPYGKMCHTSGRIDSVISIFDQTYWLYNSNRPVRRLDVSGSDTSRYDYSYDMYGRLIESRESGVTGNGPYVRTYYLRYKGAPASLAFEAERGCLSWDAVRRRGSFPCRAAGEVTAVQLYDVQGRVVWESRVEGNGMFEVPASLPSGLYYLRGGEQVVRVYILP